MAEKPSFFSYLYRGTLAASIVWGLVQSNNIFSRDKCDSTSLDCIRPDTKTLIITPDEYIDSMLVCKYLALSHPIDTTICPETINKIRPDTAWVVTESGDGLVLTNLGMNGTELRLTLDEIQKAIEVGDGGYDKPVNDFLQDWGLTSAMIFLYIFPITLRIMLKDSESNEYPRSSFSSSSPNVDHHAEHVVPNAFTPHYSSEDDERNMQDRWKQEFNSRIDEFNDDTVTKIALEIIDKEYESFYDKRNFFKLFAGHQWGKSSTIERDLDKTHRKLRNMRDELDRQNRLEERIKPKNIKIPRTKSLKSGKELHE